MGEGTPNGCDELSLARFADHYADARCRAFAPWSVMPPHVWAEEVRRMKGGARFKWGFAPYLRKPFDSFWEPAVIETILEMFSRAGKSEIILNAIGYSIDQAPRRILSLWPTSGQAEKWAKENLTGELFDETPPLHYLGSSAKSRSSGNTILNKQFPGGLLNAFGANSPGEMRRAKGNLLYGDEIDAIGTEQTDEGDQLAIFGKRGDEFPDTIRLWASYPSVTGKSRIHAKMLESDFQRYFTTCVLCGGEPFVMERTKHLRYDPDKPEGARLECPRCHDFLADAQRHAMMMQGAETDCWRATRPFRGKRGFQAGSLLWPHPVDPVKFPGGFLQMLAQKEIDAKKADNPQRALRIIVNADDAEPFDPLSEDEKPPEWKPLYERREDYTDVPARGLVITGAADLQLNRIEVEWKAWGRGEESWGLDHVVIDGDIRDVGVWSLFKRELQRKFTHESGAPMEFSLFLVDGGFWSEWLFRFLADLARNPVPGVSGKVRAVKGVGASPHPVVTDWRSIAKNLKGYHVGTWQVKELLNRRMLMQPNEDGSLPDGWMHWNQGYSEAYFQQLCTAKATVDFANGEEIRTYPGEPGVRDEGLDLNVYNYACFCRRRWSFDAIEADLLAAAKVLREDVRATTLPKSRMRRTEGFI